MGWVILSSAEARIKAKIEEAGKPLKEWDVQINYGIKTGFNEAFIIDGKTKDELVLKCPKSAEIIRPLLRGQDIKRYSFVRSDLWLINSHNGIKDNNLPKANVERDYPKIYQHLLQYKDHLVKRQDKGDHWTNLRNCAYLQEFDKPKIIWGNLNLQATFCLSLNSQIIVAPCNMLTSKNDDLNYLLAILNSPVTTYFMKNQGYSREGGYVEYKRIFIEQLPVPEASNAQRSKIELLVKRICDDRENSMDTIETQTELDTAIFELYGFSTDELKILVDK